jgi:pimeloyl-ACP methyl ester carboxylesterase
MKSETSVPAGETGPVSRSPVLRLLRAALPALSAVVPGVAARVAGSVFRLAPPVRPSARTRAFLATGRAFQVRRPGMRLQVWAWGTGPAVYLVHGWGGHGAQLSSFVGPLVQRGFRVIAFDAPAHGASAGRLSSLPQFAAALRAVVEDCGAAHAVIAHSMGGAAATLALQRGLTAERAVFVGPPADPTRWTDAFARELAIPTAVVTRMKDHLAALAGVRWNDLSVPAAAPQMTTPLLLVHDRDDAEVPWTDGASIAYAWPDAQLVSTWGLGHRRILRDAAVVARAVAFVSGVPQDVPSLACAACGQPGEEVCCETCATEADLYHRDARRRAFPSTAA